MSNEANAEVKDKAAKPVAWRVLVSEPGKDGATHTYTQKEITVSFSLIDKLS